MASRSKPSQTGNRVAPYESKDSERGAARASAPSFKQMTLSFGAPAQHDAKTATRQLQLAQPSDGASTERLSLPSLGFEYIPRFLNVADAGSASPSALPSLPADWRAQLVREIGD